MPVYQSLLEKKQNGKKSFAVLVDPDKVSPSSLNELIAFAEKVKKAGDRHNQCRHKSD